MIRLSFAAVLLYLLTVFAQAEEGTQFEDLIKLDIEDLSKIKISVASKRSEGVARAPAVAEIITSEDIENFGARTLIDVLSRLTNVQIFGSHFLPENTISIRRHATQHYSNRVLILLNGRPFRDSITGGNLTPLRGIPLGVIERIEVVRGPGSVLYGSNAFSGVIDIITKKTLEDKRGYGSLMVGSHKTLATEASVSGGADESSFMLSGRVLDTNGWEFHAVDENLLSDSFRQSETSKSLFAQVNYQKLRFNAFYGSADQANLGTTALFPSSTVKVDRWLLDLTGEHELNKDWRFSSSLTYNGLGSETEPVHSDDLLGELTLFGTLSDKIDILLGTVAEFHNGAMGSRPYRTRWNSGYAELRYMLNSSIFFTTGLQLNKPKGVTHEFSPRAAVTALLDENWTLKVLHGEAFRSAYAIETFIDLSVIQGNPSLEPETVSTSELQVRYQDSSLISALSAFISKTNDTIGRVPLDNSSLTYANFGGNKFYGLEFEFRYQGTTRISVQGSASHTGISDESSGTDIINGENTGKIGLTYLDPSSLKLGLFYSYFSSPVNQEKRLNSDILKVNPRPQGLHLISSNISYDLGQAWDSLFDMEVSFFIDNLLNDEYLIPEYNRGIINSIPQRGGRTYYAQLKASF